MAASPPPETSGLKAAELDHYLQLPLPIQWAWARFLKAYKVVLDTIDRETLAGGPMSVAEFELMLYVQISGGRIRFINLAKLSLLSQAQISRRVASLQAKGYLLREATDSDRRATFAVMTEAGAAAFEASQRPFLAALQRNFIDRISPEKLEAFSEVLAGLTDDPDFPHHEEMMLAASRDGGSLPPNAQFKTPDRARKKGP